jgi:hypothetical protein
MDNLKLQLQDRFTEFYRNSLFFFVIYFILKQKFKLAIQIQESIWPKIAPLSANHKKAFKEEKLVKRGT